MSFSIHSYLSLVTGIILIGCVSCNLFDNESKVENRTSVSIHKIGMMEIICWYSQLTLASKQLVIA